MCKSLEKRRSSSGQDGRPAIESAGNLGRPRAKKVFLRRSASSNPNEGGKSLSLWAQGAFAKTVKCSPLTRTFEDLPARCGDFQAGNSALIAYLRSPLSHTPYSSQVCLSSLAAVRRSVPCFKVPLREAPRRLHAFSKRKSLPPLGKRFQDVDKVNRLPE